MNKIFFFCFSEWSSKNYCITSCKKVLKCDPLISTIIRSCIAMMIVISEMAYWIVCMYTYQTNFCHTYAFVSQPINQNNFVDKQSIASSTVAYGINLLLDNSKKANNVTSHKVSQPQFLKRNQFKCLRKCFLSVSGCVCNSSAVAEWGSWHSLSKLANPSVIFFLLIPTNSFDIFIFKKK